MPGTTVTIETTTLDETPIHNAQILFGNAKDAEQAPDPITMEVNGRELSASFTVTGPEVSCQLISHDSRFVASSNSISAKPPAASGTPAGTGISCAALMMAERFET